MSHLTERSVTRCHSCASYINRVSELCTIIVHSPFTSEVRNGTTQKQRSWLYLNYVPKVQTNKAVMGQSHNSAMSGRYKHTSTRCFPWTCKLENGPGVFQAGGLKCGTFALPTFALVLEHSHTGNCGRSTC